MIDTRTARLQAEESHKMAIEAEIQGTTLMVFTIVTIVFVSNSPLNPLEKKRKNHPRQNRVWLLT